MISYSAKYNVTKNETMDTNNSILLEKKKKSDKYIATFQKS